MPLPLFEWFLLALAIVGWGLFFVELNHARYWIGFCREQEEQLERSRLTAERIREGKIDVHKELLRQSESVERLRDLVEEKEQLIKQLRQENREIMQRASNLPC